MLVQSVLREKMSDNIWHQKYLLQAANHQAKLEPDNNIYDTRDYRDYDKFASPNVNESVASHLKVKAVTRARSLRNSVNSNIVHPVEESKHERRLSKSNIAKHLRKHSRKLSFLSN